MLILISFKRIRNRRNFRTRHGCYEEFQKATINFYLFWDLLFSIHYWFPQPKHLLKLPSNCRVCWLFEADCHAISITLTSTYDQYNSILASNLISLTSLNWKEINHIINIYKKEIALKIVCRLNEFILLFNFQMIIALQK